MQFQSRYLDESPEHIAEWAYDLHEYLIKGGGTQTIPAYHVVKNEFALKWWLQDQSFKNLVGIPQDAWLYEAIIDGANLWFTYIQLDGSASTSDLFYFDALLREYRKAGIAEIFYPPSLTPAK